MALNIALVLALIVSNCLWWLHVRHMSGITSDLKDVRNDVSNAAGAVQSAATQVKAAAQNVTKG